MTRATLVVSYWSAPSSNLSWFDQPPCEAGGRGQDACGETVRISKFSLRPGPFNGTRVSPRAPRHKNATSRTLRGY